MEVKEQAKDREREREREIEEEEGGWVKEGRIASRRQTHLALVQLVQLDIGFSPAFLMLLQCH